MPIAASKHDPDPRRGPGQGSIFRQVKVGLILSSSNYSSIDVATWLRRIHVHSGSR